MPCCSEQEDHGNGRVTKSYQLPAHLPHHQHVLLRSIEVAAMAAKRQRYDQESTRLPSSSSPGADALLKKRQADEPGPGSREAAARQKADPDTSPSFSLAAAAGPSSSAATAAAAVISAPSSAVAGLSIPSSSSADSSPWAWKPVGPVVELGSRCCLGYIGRHTSSSCC